MNVICADIKTVIVHIIIPIHGLWLLCGKCKSFYMNRFTNEEHTIFLMNAFVYEISIY